jgi:hypothetical protein
VLLASSSNCSFSVSWTAFAALANARLAAMTKSNRNKRIIEVEMVFSSCGGPVQCCRDAPRSFVIDSYWLRQYDPRFGQTQSAIRNISPTPMLVRQTAMSEKPGVAFIRHSNPASITVHSIIRLGRDTDKWQRRLWIANDSPSGIDGLWARGRTTCHLIGLPSKPGGILFSSHYHRAGAVYPTASFRVSPCLVFLRRGSTTAFFVLPS